MTLFRKANIFILQPSISTPRRKTFLLIVDVEMIFRFLPCRVGPFFDQEESQQFGEMAQPDHKTSNLQIKRHRRLRKLFLLRLQFSLQFSSTYTNCELELHLKKQIQYSINTKYSVKMRITQYIQKGNNSQNGGTCIYQSINALVPISGKSSWDSFICWQWYEESIFLQWLQYSK